MTIRRQAEQAMRALPDPTWIHVPAAGVTVPFRRGLIKFRVLRRDDLTVIEYLDADSSLIGRQYLNVASLPGDTIELTVPDVLYTLQWS